MSWNNRQALGFAGPDENVFSSTYRSVLLEDPLRDKLRGGRKLTLPEVVDIMEVAGTGDLRAHAVLPLALRIIGRPKDPRLREAVALLQQWRRAGGRRIDGDRDGVYEHTDAIRIMDAWWPRWVRAEFRPRMGKAAVNRLLARYPMDGTRYALLVGVCFALIGAALSTLRLSPAGARGAEAVRVSPGQRAKGE